MPTARIIHLNRQSDARYPSMIFEIEGRLYIDLLSATLFSIPPRKRDCLEFLYQMRSFDNFRQYYFDGDILCPLSESVLVAVFGMGLSPLYLQHFTEVYQKVTDDPSASIGVHFGWQHVIEILYHTQNNRMEQKRRSLSEILSLPLATVEVFPFDCKPSHLYFTYAFFRTIWGTLKAPFVGNC